MKNTLAGEIIDEASDNDLAISFQPDMRHANIQFQHQNMSAKLCDLPCVVEVIQLAYCGIQSEALQNCL